MKVLEIMEYWLDIWEDLWNLIVWVMMDQNKYVVWEDSSVRKSNLP